MKLLKKFETINLLSAQFLLLLHLHLSNNLNLVRHKTSMKGSMKTHEKFLRRKKKKEEKVKRAKDVKKLNDRVKSIRIPVNEHAAREISHDDEKQKF